MVAQGDVAGHAEKLRVRIMLQGRFQRGGAMGGMRFHNGKLVGSKLAGLQENGVGNGDFADVMERAGLADRADILVVDNALVLGRVRSCWTNVRQ